MGRSHNIAGYRTALAIALAAGLTLTPSSRLTIASATEHAVPHCLNMVFRASMGLRSDLTAKHTIYKRGEANPREGQIAFLLAESGMYHTCLVVGYSAETGVRLLDLHDVSRGPFDVEKGRLSASERESIEKIQHRLLVAGQDLSVQENVAVALDQPVSALNGYRWFKPEPGKNGEKSSDYSDAQRLALRKLLERAVALYKKGNLEEARDLLADEHQMDILGVMHEMGEMTPITLNNRTDAFAILANTWSYRSNEGGRSIKFGSPHLIEPKTPLTPEQRRLRDDLNRRFFELDLEEWAHAAQHAQGSLLSTAAREYASYFNGNTEAEIPFIFEEWGLDLVPEIFEPYGRLGKYRRFKENKPLLYSEAKIQSSDAATGLFRKNFNLAIAEGKNTAVLASVPVGGVRLASRFTFRYDGYRVVPMIECYDPRTQQTSSPVPATPEQLDQARDSETATRQFRGR